ncbi:tape measure protein [Fibrella sp. ES10-3-2-2]|nr:hypothetical protein A6C57_23370 [Fibrella sp. ES10-3-2-2]
MSENIRVVVQAVSELPTINDQLFELIKLTKQAQSTAETYAKQAAFARGDELQAIKAVQTAIDNQTASLKKAGAETTNNTQKASSEFKGLETQISNFQKLLIAAFSFNELKSFAMDVIDAKTKIDSIKIALDTMIGSKRESTELFGQIVDLAKKTPFSLEELSEQTAKLKAYGIETSKIVPTIEALGNMAAAVGKEKLPQLTLAYGQVMNLGKLMGTEIRQFTEAGIDLYGLLAKSMDKTKDAVISMAQEHTIMASDVEKAVRQASEVGGVYYNLMRNQAQTLGGQVANLGDQFFTTKAKIGDFFEGEIKGGIKLLSDLMDALAGSDGAMKRTVSTVTAAISTWVAARTALNLLNAQTLINNGETDKLSTSQKLLTASSGTMSAAFGVATNGIRGLWAAITANPIGMVVTGVSLLVAAWETWNAVNEEVTAGIGQQEYDLQREQLELNSLVNAVYAASEGTDRRKEAIDELISKYPDYFSGLDRETTTNADLRAILEKVNDSYGDRIALAREAYKADQLADQQKGLLEKERDLFERVRNSNAINEEVLSSFGGNVRKLNAYLLENVDVAAKINGSGWDILWKGKRDLTAELMREMDQLDKGYKDSIESTAALRKTSQESQLAAEKTHHEKVMAQLKDGSKEEEVETDRYEKAIASIKGEGRKTEIKAQVDHADKVKTINALSAKEISALLKEQVQETYKERLSALDAQEKAEMEAANKIVVSKKATDAQLVAAEQEVSAKLLAIREKFNEKRREAWEAHKIELQDSMLDAMEAAAKVTDAEYHALDEKKKSEKEKRAEVKKTKEEILKDEEETQKVIIDNIQEQARLRQETVESVKQSRRELMGMAFDMLDQQGGLLGSLSGIGREVFNNFDLLSGKTKSVTAENLRVSQETLATTRRAYEEFGIGTLADVTAAETKQLDSKKKSLEATAETSKATLSIIGLGFSAIQMLSEAFEAGERAKLQALYDSITSARKAYRDFYDWVIDEARQAYGEELTNFKGTYDQKKSLIESHYSNQRDLMSQQAKLDADLAKAQDEAAIGVMAREQRVDDMRALMRKIQQDENEKALRERIMQIEIEQARVKDLYAAEMQSIDEALQAFKKAKQEELDTLAENLDKQKALTEQFYSDKALRLLEDDTYRKELLAEGEAREVKALEEARDRELKRAQESGATAEELARITTAFNKLIADKHKEYQDAMGDKTKETSLANQEIKAKEKDTVNRLEEEKRNAVIAIQDQITAAEQNAASQKENANRAYIYQVRRANEELFEANKQMKIVELNAQLALVRGSGGSRDVQVALINAIQSLGGQSIGNVAAERPITPFGDALPDAVNDNGTYRGYFDKDGNAMDLTYNASRSLASMRYLEAYNSKGELQIVYLADGYVKATGKKYATGTEFVDGEPGIDKVPAMLTRGERVLTVQQNQQLGGISNEALMRRLMMPRISMPTLPVRLNLPASAGSGMSGGDVIDELQALRQEIRDKKLLQLNIDNGGIAMAMLSESTKQQITANKLQF